MKVVENYEGIKCEKCGDKYNIDPIYNMIMCSYCKNIKEIEGNPIKEGK